MHDETREELLLAILTIGAVAFWLDYLYFHPGVKPALALAVICSVFAGGMWFGRLCWWAVQRFTPQPKLEEDEHDV